MNDKIQLAAMGEHLAEQQPMCMAKRIEELEAQVLVMGGLLREARPYMDNRGGAGVKGYTQLAKEIDSALAGKLPERPDTEWTDAASTPTAADYREMQAQHDQLQSKYKAGVDILGESFDVLRRVETLLDAIPTRLQEHEEDSIANIGRIVNGSNRGLYHVVRDFTTKLAMHNADSMPDHPEQPLEMVPEGWLLSLLPQATPSQKEGGWTLEFDFLDSITDEVVARHGYDTSLEVVETVLVAVDAMLAAAPKPEAK